MRRGLFIAVEGESACARMRYVKVLRDTLVRSVLYRYPDLHSRTGERIAQHLKAPFLSSEDLCVLVGLNRLHDCRKIMRDVGQGHHVIAEQYSASGIVQARSQGVSYYQCFQAEEGLPTPDMVLYVYTSAAPGPLHPYYQELIDETWVVVDQVRCPHMAYGHILCTLQGLLLSSLPSLDKY